ncbi:MAG: putative transposase [Yoonia sp.]|jgi:putative transposase
MLPFRQSRSVQKLVSIHASVQNHFNHERHINSRTTFKLKRTAALAEWRELFSAKVHAIFRKMRMVRINLTAA